MQQRDPLKITTLVVLTTSTMFGELASRINSKKHQVIKIRMLVRPCKTRAEIIRDNPSKES